MSKKISVLVLDDESIVCERLKDHLEKKGCTVEVFTTSASALERLRSGGFDVVVTDLKMDGASGMDVLRAVRESDYSTEVIMITGYASIETSHEAQAVGVFEFVAKPFRMSDIYNLVKKAARKARKAQ